MSLYLDTDPLSGAIETFDYDESTDTVIIKRTCDVQPIIDRNMELQNHTDGWVGEGRDMKWVASIPLELAYKWLIEDGISCWKKEHWPAVRKRINSNEYYRIRCAPGRV
jgi:hypothetical protein